MMDWWRAVCDVAFIGSGVFIVLGEFEAAMWLMLVAIYAAVRRGNERGG